MAWITLLPSISASLIAGQCWVAAAAEPWPGPAALLAQAPTPDPSGVPAEVQRWADEAIAADQRGDLAEALQWLQKVVKWLQSQPEPILPFRAQALFNQGVLLSLLGRQHEALTPSKEAAQLYRELATTDPSFRGDLARSLNILGNRYSELGRRQEALAPSEEAVKIRRELAASNPAFRGDLARSLTNMGIRYHGLGRRQEALAHTKEAAQYFRELATTNPAFRNDLAAVLNNLGVNYSELGRTQEALATNEEATEIFRKLAATNPAIYRDLGRSLNNLGNRYSELGRLQQALAPSEEAAQIHRELAASNPAFRGDLAGSLNNLGNHYSGLGRRQEALATNEEATQIYRELAETNAAFLGDLARSLHNLGDRYSELGRRQEALPPSEEAVKIRRELATSNPGFRGDLARSLNNLGIRYRELGRLHDALAPSKEALKIRRQLATSNPAFRSELAGSLNNLGISYSELGRLHEALAPSEEAAQSFRELATSNPAFRRDLAGSLNNLGNRYSELGRRQDALAPSEEAVKIRRELAANNPAFRGDLALSLNNLANLRLLAGDISAALPLLQEMVASEVLYLQGVLPLLPEARRQDLVSVFGRRWQEPFSQAQQGEAGAELALFTRLNRQGLLQDIQRTQTLLARNDLQRPIYEQLSGVISQLASTTLTPEQQSQLLGQKERLEQELYQQLPKIRPQLVEPAQIARLLPAAAALVEFQRYWAYEPGNRTYDSPRYLALLLKADGTIRAYPLGEAGAIDWAVASALAASADGQRQEVANDRLAQVSQLVLGPLQGELVGVRELFVSPDGELNRLPFAILPAAGQNGRTLAETVQLRILTTGRDLLRLQPSPKPGGPSVLITNPDFDASTGRSPLHPIKRQPLSAGWLGLPPWQPLGGTADEAQMLAHLLRPHHVITGRDATASRALQQKAPRIFHIATHGFFLDDQTNQRPEKAFQRQDPLQRSGLVFAGANNPTADPDDDGYLTAAEAITMDLDGTELVTLSACETGLGSVRSGEGVYGLQRALAVAGARSTLLSLWKVDDALTAAFMEQYYKRLKAGEGRADALRNTQADFRTNRNSTFNDVRVWGAFQLSGDWRPLPGL